MFTVYLFTFETLQSYPCYCTLHKKSLTEWECFLVMWLNAEFSFTEQGIYFAAPWTRNFIHSMILFWECEMIYHLQPSSICTASIHRPNFEVLEHLSHALRWSCNWWADSLWNPVTAFVQSLELPSQLFLGYSKLTVNLSIK